KVPCGFTGFAKAIPSGGTVQIDTLIGYTHDVAALAEKRIELAKTGHAWFEAKQQDAVQVVGALLDDVTTKTAYPVFDEMIRQNYLDNLLRGGYPMTISAGDKKFVYYLYSRKHGDLERDYNFFSIAPEFYSQGNGNFRDVCQNRRSDVFFHPETGDYSIKVFASLIQADGYNPLGINGSTFEIADKTKIAPLAAHCFGAGAALMVPLLSGKFTPGSIVNAMEQKKIQSPLSDDELFALLFADAHQNIEAAWNEGYWTDHWTYILDLVERYLEIFPDRRDALLFGDDSYRTFESPVSVRPRHEKHVIDKSGAIRQYGALRHPDKEKIARLKLNEHGTNWFAAGGAPYETNLFAKLLILAANKFATLDPEGLGIEMEANRPGWNDAMNGLAGIFGSGMSETVELGRLARFLKRVPDGKLSLPLEFVTFAQRLEGVKLAPGFARWDAVATIREEYRESVRFGSAQTIDVEASVFRPLVDLILATAEEAVKRAIKIGNGILPTYFYYEATAFEPLRNNDGSPTIGSYGLPLAQVSAFARKRLPDFLEAPARWMKTAKDKQEAIEMADAIKASDLYDAPLGTYKTSADLDACGHEIGRIRAFTKGWLERESNFLHMTYKYLLGLFKAGLYVRFFEEARTNLVCFMDPATYGRPTIENSSFIATSNNPNPAVRGQGFVSRLSGSTAELLSIWTIALFGKELFRFENGKLTLALKPLLPADFFREGRVEATFIGQKVIYVNSSDKDGWNLEPMRYELRKNGMAVKTIVGRRLEGEDAAAVRNGAYDEIVVLLS
ncbi:MAG: cellobiose phosphorylase, partial [Bacillota bacterium]|nr:cellobiose phosphorylase [Bacillota bacterium]